MSDKQRFQPVKGKKANIDETEILNGQLLIATDTGEMFLDTSNSTRIPIGGSGVSILYANDPAPQEISTNQFNVAAAYVEGQVKVDDLIMNIPDGSFYKVLSLGTTYLFCQRLSISGTGGGSGEGGGGVATPKVGFINSLKDQLKNIYVYGEDFYFTVIPYAENDTTVNVTIELFNQADSTKAYYTYTKNIRNYSELSINLGAEFKTGTTIISVGLSTNNSGSTIVKYDGQQVVELRLDEDSFRPEKICTENDPIQFRCKPVGKVKKVLHILVDGYEVKNETISEAVSDNSSVSNITGTMLATHGVHSLEAYLTAEIDGKEIQSNSLIYQVAYSAPGQTSPVIWFMQKPNSIEQYQDVVVKYMVYDPTIGSAGTMTIEQLHDGSVITVLEDVQYSASTAFTWVITDYEVGDNYYGISCKGTTESFVINITPSDRDMDYVQQDQMIMNLNANGRTNNESLLSRQTLQYTWNGNKVNCEFDGFNWHTDGWQTDSDGKSFLRISNGASLSIPLNDPNVGVGIQLNKDATQSYTFEFRLKIRNITSYDTLIKNVTKYLHKDDGNYYTWDELAEKAEIDGLTPEDLMKNDDFGAAIIKIEKIVSADEGICISYLNNTGKAGFALGTQESYFGTGNEYVNAKYKEEETFNISYVVSANTNASLSRVYVYVNGLLTGISTISTPGGIRAFEINNPAILISSDYCDIDLYNVRVYNMALDSWAIVQNYLSDLRDIEAYDQNQISNNVNNLTAIDYDKLINYNQEQIANGKPNLLSMPYLILQTVDNVGEGGTYVTDDGTAINKKHESIVKYKISDENLPFKKGNARYVKATFVNPTLDYAYTSGELEEVGKSLGVEDVGAYYAYHCPSFVAYGGELDVQGTSSQGYPRRNYKLKLKNADYWRYTGGPNASKDITGESDNVWCMDVNSSAVHNNKFTLKIDYMESSGSYNTGFANMVHYMYEKHPLDYYNEVGAASGIVESKVLNTYRTSVQGFPVLTFHATKDSSGKMVYSYIGRYNMNLDKGSDDSYGFKYDGKNSITGDKFKKAAECWEMADNQGSFCSFKFPDTKKVNFSDYLLDSGRPEIIDHLEYRYNDDADNLDICYDYIEGGSDGKTTRGDLESPAYKADIQVYQDEIDRILAENTELATQLKQLEAALKENPDDTSIEAQIKALKDANGITEQEQLIDVQTNAKATKTDFDSLIFKRYANIEKLYQWLNKCDIAANPYADDAAVEASSQIEDYTLENPQLIGGKTYKYDTKEYRSAKFKAEFDKHLNLEYCLVYYIMTETLLCYDSRGKNMMIASWGPMEKGGEYIWFPIFYDIDTQLGINNTGIPTWDYDVDASLNAAFGSEVFSTPNSILWQNLQTCFLDNIKQKYQEMRNDKLTQDFIENAYRCDPDTFNTSYACKGVRPLVAINADAEYKYVLPTLEPGKGTNYGYITTSGTWVRDSGNSFFYACQGDRDLSRQLLVRNRLNFLDSVLQAGIYSKEGMTSKANSLSLRVNANLLDISDRFLDKDTLDPDKDTGFSLSPLGSNPLDATPYYQIKPFLSQYVAIWFDDTNTTTPVKYTQDLSYIQPVPPDNKIAEFKSSSLSQQLHYIPGIEYISKIDGLPQKYSNELFFDGAKRMTEIVLGQDSQSYYNNLSVSLSLADAEDTVENPNAQAKTLLKKVVLTGLTNITSDKTFIDLGGSPKLEEFRALNSNVTGCQIAIAAPVEYLQLPKSTNKLMLNTMYRLTNVITDNLAADLVNAPSVPGLYVEGLTDAINKSENLAQAIESASSQAFTLSTIELKNDYLGYDSYQIVKTAVAKKIKLNSSLQIRLENITWTPFEVLDEAAELSKDIVYYELNNHYQYTPIEIEDETFTEKRLNSLIFTKNSEKDETQIQSMELLDKFIAANKINSNLQFNDTTYPTNIPYVSGEIYVDNSNGEAISELAIQKYNASYPSLDIRVAKVEKNYTIKFVQKDETGLIKTYFVQKASNCAGAAEAGDNEYFANPNRNSTLIPSKNNYDFFGWSTDGSQEKVIIQPGGDGVYYDDVWEKYDFSTIAVDNVVTLYAAFELHKYNATFYNYDGTVLGTTQTPYDRNKPINTLSIIPAKTADDLDLYEVYGFEGWAMKSAPNRVLDMSTVHPIMDYEFIAVFKEKSVYDNVLDPQYLSVIAGSLSVKSGVQLSGKITLPTTINGIDITTIAQGGFSEQSEITHIFWSNNVNNKVSTIKENAFSNCTKLVFYEMSQVVNVRVEASAFQYTQVIAGFNNDDNLMDNFFKKVTFIGANAFAANASSAKADYTTTYLKVAGSIADIGNSAFGYCENLAQVIIGDSDNPVNGLIWATGAKPFQKRSGGSKIEINMTYYSSVPLTEEQKAIIKASSNVTVNVSYPNV